MTLAIAEISDQQHRGGLQDYGNLLCTCSFHANVISDSYVYCKEVFRYAVHQAMFQDNYADLPRDAIYRGRPPRRNV